MRLVHDAVPSVALVATILLGFPRSVSAQAPASGAAVSGAISIMGGSSTTLLGTSARGVTVAPSLTLSADPNALFGLGVSATQYADRQSALGANGSTALRLPLSSLVALTLNGGADVTKTSYQFSYASARALPAVEAHAGGAALYAGVQAATATTWRSIATAGVPGGLLAPASRASQSTIATSHDGIGAIVGGAMTFVTGPHETLQVGVREEHNRIDTLHLIDRSGTLALTSGPLVAAVTLGMHLEPAEHTMFGNADVSYALTPTLAVRVGAGSYPIDRLLDTPPGHYLDLGLSIRVGGSGRSMPSAAAPELTRLTIRAPDAKRVELAGDFSNWKLVPATRGANGVWYAELRIPPGRYRYAFRIDGTTWTIPDGAAEVEDDLGGHSAWLDVGGGQTPSASEPRPRSNML